MITKPRVLCLALLLLAVPAHAERVNIAAIVNDEIITTTDVNERRDLIMQSNNLEPTVENQRRVTPRIIQSLIEETLEMQEAKRLSITVKDEELEAAIGQLEASRRMPAGSLRDSLEKQGLSVRSMENQLRAQLAWNKVVQRKLRRQVNISEDEVVRAQTAEAAAPGVPEVRIAAISLIITKPEDEAKQSELAQQLSAELAKGTSLGALAQPLLGRDDVRLSPPGWVEEEKLQPAMQQALRALQPGQTTPPLKSLNTYQLVQLLERRVAKKVPETTEVAVKEILLPVPPAPDKKFIVALQATAEAVHANPGSCMEEALGTPAPGAKVRFLRTLVGQLPDELRSLITNLSVGEISQPLMTGDAVRMFMLCERIDPSTGNLPPAAEVRKKLFSEKMDLEAQKHLRNLKRDAFIEIKGEPRAAE